MFGFGKKKKTREEFEVYEPEDIVEELESASESEERVEASGHQHPNTAQETSVFSREEGPWDIEETSAYDGYLDFGSMRIRAQDGLNMRLDVEQKSKQMVAVTLTQGKSSLQVQAFAAPKSSGIWDEIRAEIAESVRKQGGSVEIRNGRFGQEMISRLPATAADGRRGFRVARFVGVDGPRWFLRGVFSGDAALKPHQAQEMEAIFRSIVVVRGEEPRPPRDLLPMLVPESIRTAQQSADTLESQGVGKKFEMPRRGPEITEIR